MAPRRTLSLLLFLAVAACGDDAAQAPSSDAQTPLPDGGGGSGGTTPPRMDAASELDGALPPVDGGRDAAQGDASADASGDASELAPDAAIDAGADAGDPNVNTAAAGERCALTERIALIELLRYPGGSTLYVSGKVFDRVDPLWEAPALSDDACDFHSYMPQGACGACSADQTCGLEGECVPAQRTLKDAVLTLRAGGEQQVFEADDTSGDIYGEVELDAPFSLELTFAAQTVLLEELAIPSALEGLVTMVQGDSSAPEGLDVTWSGPNDGLVFTHIPINHHATGPTFTECWIDASAHALHVDDSMLVPLSVVTGLEFQGVEHVHVAAAETPAGCVELRATQQHNPF